MTLEWTGERVIEGKSPDNVMALHKARYCAAIQSGLITGKRVLDVPCGSGYGSAMLGNHAEMVMGVDNDAQTIGHCIDNHMAKGVYFQHRDMTADLWFFEADMFDVAICFEGIEHVSEAEGVLVIRELARITTSFLILSTPNKETSLSNDTYHQREYSLKELHQLIELEGLWKISSIHGQWRTGKPEVCPCDPQLCNPDFFYVVAYRTSNEE